MAAPKRERIQRRQWLTTPQIARLIDFHPKTLLQYANAHRVSPELAVKVGKRWRWRADFAQRPSFLEVPWK